MRKIHTDKRSNLEQSTIISLMNMKFNCCCDIKIRRELRTWGETGLLIHRSAIEDLSKDKVVYDVKKFPLMYVEGSAGQWTVASDSAVKELCPKMDTEVLFVLYRKAEEAQKAAGPSNRLHYGVVCWSQMTTFL